ncbi:MAG TPA: hypothetical protein PK365_12240 [Nitrospira sp.]|nr:hypothetical protein [Nitrospira sp.]HNG01990.1 hypothetical protein [Nitrospira sp.]
MSAITRAIQHAQMVKDIEDLKRLLEMSSSSLLRQAALIDKLTDRVIALEQKRGPGRPKNEDRKPVGSD